MPSTVGSRTHPCVRFKASIMDLMESAFGLCNFFWYKNTVTKLIRHLTALDKLRDTTGNNKKAVQTILMLSPAYPAGRRCDWLVW